ncbi:MAG: NUDIX domain-containing protein [Candidatus Saccharibacteria bacterium]|nr:MAG: NUDIX domain-containing protein [Candidatus Saccharibacteria bacterium]
MQVRRVATRGIIFKDGKMLCQQLKAGDDNSKRDYWCTPGGGLDIGESIKDGLYREMIEETGIAPKIGKLLFIQQFSEDGVKEQMEFFFHIENAEDYEVIDLSATTHGELEIEHVEFVDPTKHNVLPAFLQSMDIQAHIDSGDPVHVYYETH